jgi:hypothetical protein
MTLTTSNDEMPTAHDKSNCAFCSSFRDFELPDHLLDQLSKGNVVIFAGAGVSTENRTVFPWTFYEEIHSELKLKDGDKPSFPTLMSMYCQRPDGRIKLIQHIHKRLNYISSFSELYRYATRFHRELSTLFYIDTIITTNWDDYFERECGASPLSTPADFALWNVPGRKVYKIHGSANNYGSIIATEDDYARAQESLEKGSLGSALKLLLTTKTIIYIGYSLLDYDFVSILAYLRRELGCLSPLAYVVSLDETAEDRFKELGLHPIYSDATHFISVLKKHIEGDGHFLPDRRFDSIPKTLDIVNIEHERLSAMFNPNKTPEIIYAAAYQDGLAHAFERIIDLRKSGEYSHKCHVIQLIRSYERIRKDNTHLRHYWDVAYIDGYMNGLMYLICDDKERKYVPLYYIYGAKDHPTSFTKYKAALKSNMTVHKSSLALAQRLVAQKLGNNDVLHHTPFISWGVD